MTDSRVAPAQTLPEDTVMNTTLFGHMALFGIGASSGIQIANFTATALSIVCLLLVPAFLLTKHRGVELLPLVLAAFGWISFLVSCLVNHVSVLWPNAVAPAAFSLYFIGLTVLTGRVVDAVATVLAGIGAGTVVFFLTQGIALTQTGSFLDLWKYGIAHGVTLVIVYCVTIGRASLLLHGVVLTALGTASLGLNFRSHALVCLLAAATLFSHRFLATRVRRAWRFAGIIALGVLFGSVMPIAARAGILGPALQAKTLEQDTTHLPVLLAGRTEPPMTLTAIMERPLLGWGSAANLTPDVYAQAEHLAVRFGYAPTFAFEIYWRLPVNDYSAMHSILLGSWGEGGVVAALLPLWLLTACLGIIWNYARFAKWAPLSLLLGFQGVWDLFYAPWTYNMLPEFACIALLYGAVHFRGRRASP